MTPDDKAPTTAAPTYSAVDLLKARNDGASAAIGLLVETIRARAEVYRRDGDSARTTACESLIEELKTL